MDTNILHNPDEELFRVAFDHGLAYWQGKEGRRAFPGPNDLAQLSTFNEPFPSSGVGAGEIITQLQQVGAAATVNTIGGRYFGFVTGAVLPAAMAARIMTDFWDQNSALYLTLPVHAQLESVVEQWLISIFDLPRNTACGFVSGTSVSILCGLAAARHHLLSKLDWETHKNGVSGAPHIKVVLGRQAHGAVLKAINILGFGQDCIRWVDVDDEGRIISSAVPDLDDRTIVVLQAGNVNSGAFDPFHEICERADRAGAWVHVDGAFGLWAYASNALRAKLKGVTGASSWSMDCHKTLNTPYDGGLILCRHAEALKGVFSISGEYLKMTTTRESMLLTPEMSRRGRVFEIWAALKSLGRDGFEQMVTGFHLKAVSFAHALRAEGFSIVNEVHFNQVLVYQDADVTMKILARIQEGGVCWCGSSMWRNQSVIRISVCSWATTDEDIKISVEAFVAARETVIGSGG